jgi:hypothetical protein
VYLCFGAVALMLFWAGMILGRFSITLLPVRWTLWPVIVMTTSDTCRCERRTSMVIGIGAIGFATGPLLGSLLLRTGLEARFFTVQLALGALVLALGLLAAASYRARVSSSSPR